MALSTISLRRAELTSFPRQHPSKSPYPDSSSLPTALTEYSPSRSFTIICSGLNRFLPIIPPPYQIVFISLTFGLLTGGRVTLPLFIERLIFWSKVKKLKCRCFIIRVNVRFGSEAVLWLNFNCSMGEIKVGAQKKSVVDPKRTFS